MSRLLTEIEAKAFALILQDYQPNNEVLELFRASNFTVIAGPAGAGKDTLRDSLIMQWPQLYVPILSTTTRPQRHGELDGRTYHFRGVDGVRQSLENREFFQAALVHNQQVSCLHVDEIKKLNKTQTGLSILIPSTELELRIIKRDIKTIFLTPPNATILRQRLLEGRVLEEDEIARRLAAAKKELEFALQSPHYYCLVTETVMQASQDAHTYIQNGVIDQSKDAAARSVIQQIVSEL